MHDPFYDIFPHPPEPAWRTGEMALITIDMQYMDAHPDGWMGRAADAVGKGDVLTQRYEAIARALPRIRQLQDAFRAHGEQVLHARIAFRTDDGREAGRAFMPSPHEQSIARDERDDEILSEVAPVGDELVFSKTSSSVFSTTDIERVLWNLGVRHLVFTGLVTDGCVELSARDAADRGFRVTLVEDATCSSTPEAHEDAIARMTDGGFIVAKSTEETLELLESMSRALTPAGVGDAA
jgi:ureidoacrylate peracid hydrolase